MNLTCAFRWGKAHERCLEEQRLRQEQRQQNREDRQAGKQEHRQALAEQGALPGQLLVEAHGDSNDSANQFWGGWFGNGGGGQQAPVYVPVPSQPQAAPPPPASDTTPYVVATAIAVGLVALGAALWPR